MAKFRDSILGSVVILGITCLVIVAALAVTNKVTEPIIEKAELDAAESARQSVLPAATSFTQVNDDLQGFAEKAYQADNGAGYVFEVLEKGFGGEIKFIVGIDNQEKFSGATVLSHDETPGLGSKITEEEYLSQYIGKTNAMDVDNVTSATVSSQALKRALEKAQNAYKIATGQEVDASTEATTEATGEAETTTEATEEGTEELTEATPEQAETTTEATEEASTTDDTTEATEETESKSA